MSSITMVNTCVVCNSTTNLQACGRCKVVQYCGRSCQSADWTSHKLVCIEGNAYKEKLADIKFMLSVAPLVDFLHALALAQGVFKAGRLMCVVENCAEAGRAVHLRVHLPADPETGPFHIELLFTLVNAAYTIGVKLDHDRALAAHTAYAGRAAESIDAMSGEVLIVIKRDGAVIVGGATLV